MSRENRIHILKNVLVVNSLLVTEVIIDPHIDKHNDHICDALVLSLVTLLDGKNFTPSSTEKEFNYYVSHIQYEKKAYRLVWLQEIDCFYIGIITAFRDRGFKI